MMGICYRVPIAICQKILQTHINTGMFASRLMHDASFCLYSKLSIVTISTFDNANSFDLLEGKRLNFTSADEPQPPDAAAIGEGDMLAICL